MRNKKKIIAGASVGAVAVLAIGAFAFFSDTDTDYVPAKVGTVDVEQEDAGLTSYYGSKKPKINTETGEPERDDKGNIIYEDGERTEAPATLLNPGDNDNEGQPSDRPGTDHELNFKFKNVGTKSILTRAVIMVSAYDANNVRIELDKEYDVWKKDDNGGYVMNEDGTHATEKMKGEDIIKQILISTYEGKKQGESVNTEGVEEQKLVNLLQTEGYEADQAVVYILDGDTVLNGVGDGAEQEPGVETDTVEYVIDLGMSGDVDSSNPLQGGTVVITVQVQAMQYRNTDDSDWETIFGKDYTMVVETTDHEADKHSNPFDVDEFSPLETSEEAGN